MKYIIMSLQLLSLIIIGVLLIVIAIPIYILAVFLTINPNKNEQVRKPTSDLKSFDILSHKN